MKVLNKRTRGGKSVGSSKVVYVQQHSKIHKKKRTAIRRMKQSQYVLQEEEKEDVEVATSLVARMEREKKVVEDSCIQQAVNIANEIEISPASLLKEIVAEDAQKVIELAEDVQELVTKESNDLLKVNLEDQRREGTSEVAKGNGPPHTISDNSTKLDTSSPSSSSDTSSIPSPSN